jgi:RHS repeat-associated protein
MRDDLQMQQEESNQGRWACASESRPERPGSVRRPDGPDLSEAVTYAYDALGDRVRPDTWKKDVMVTTRFLSDGLAVWTDLEGADADPACHVDSSPSSGGRYYDSAAGRWLQEDSIGFDGGDANFYRYAGNSATNATDPSGLADIKLLAPPSFLRPENQF